MVAKRTDRLFDCDVDDCDVVASVDAVSIAMVAVVVVAHSGVVENSSILPTETNDSFREFIEFKESTVSAMEGSVRLLPQLVFR